jgi:hypothetical protein
MEKEKEKTETSAQTGPTSLLPPLSHLQTGPTHQAFLPPRATPARASRRRRALPHPAEPTSLPWPSQPRVPLPPSRAQNFNLFPFLSPS